MSFRVNAWPMKPVAPVTRSFLRTSSSSKTLSSRSLARAARSGHTSLGPGWHVLCIARPPSKNSNSPMHPSELQAPPQSVADERRIRTVSVVVVNYNGAGTVLDTLDSLFRQRGVAISVVVVDDGATDGSPEAIARQYPEVEIHREPHNTKDVNRLRNIGLSRASADKVLVTDNDVVFEPDCLSELIRAMEGDSRVALCLPRMMYAQAPDTVYMAGGRVHYAGATIAPHRHEPFDGRIEPRPAIGGGIVLLDRRKLSVVGGFDEGYRLAWGDDVELHQRLLLSGYRCLY